MPDCWGSCTPPKGVFGFGRWVSGDSEGKSGGSAPDCGSRAAVGRLGPGHPRDRAPARVPAGRPDRDRGDAPASRPLEPPRALRHGGARSPALGRAEAVRVERVHLADRVAPAGAGADAGEPARSAVRVGATEAGVPEAESRLPALRAARARAARAAALARARGP